MHEPGDDTESEAVRTGSVASAPPSSEGTVAADLPKTHEPRLPAWIYRHARATRALHWINFFTLVVMLMSGLQIFNARPDLYWGKTSHFNHPLLSLGARENSHGRLVGVTTVGGYTFDTTGVLGVSAGADGAVERGFPRWATLPGTMWLAMGRRWHLFFAWIFVFNGLAYAGISLWNGHLRRDLLPHWHELRHLGAAIADHARLRFPRGEEARHYNVLQKLAYLFVIFGLGPLAILTGLTMSPTMDAGFPGLLWFFGGRQSARTLHFIVAFSFLGFFVIHIAMVLLSGLWNNLRSMITGRYAIALPPAAEEPALSTPPPDEAAGVDRRGFVLRATTGASALLLGGAGTLMLGNMDRLSRGQRLPRVLDLGGGMAERAQHLLVSSSALAPEYTKADIAPVFRANGTTDPDSARYRALARNHFRDWRLQLDGLVERPLSVSLAALHAMPARTQITRHDCVEGWSCIGEWTGVPLRDLLAQARPMPGARYVMFFCADPMDGANHYYESLDLASATQTQTILAYRLNGAPLPIENGAPLRLRVERQLGYKMAKYLTHIQVVDDYRRFGGGHGGYWEDQGYAWYAGI